MALLKDVAASDSRGLPASLVRVCRGLALPIQLLHQQG